MKKLFNNILKKTFLAFLFWNYKCLIRFQLNGKNNFIKKYVDKVYEIYPNYLNVDNYVKKIMLPYIMINNVNRNNINIPYEILEVITLKSGDTETLHLKQTKSCVLPLCILDEKGKPEAETKVLLSFGKETFTLLLKYNNRFHYLPLSSEKKFDKIEIKSNAKEIAIGRVVLNDKPLLDNKPKLIVHIFVDALTQCIIEKYGFDIMSNTKKIFSKGSKIHTNAYAQSEWTLSSMAGVFTGKYTNEHLIYHPRREDKIAGDTLASQLKTCGYQTFGCTNVPKLSPFNGFDKGFDRYILANDRDSSYIINEALEQLESFDGNQYLFLGFFDVHESHLLPSISTQLNNSLDDFQFKPLKGSSKETSVACDNERIKFYKESISHLDRKLNTLYNAIADYDENAFVVFHSDHGVNFMVHTEELLSREREKVVFLYRNNKPQQIDESIKEIRDLHSMLCDDLDISHRQSENGLNISITESLYPNKHYEMAVRNNVHVLFYKVSWHDVLEHNIETYIPDISCFLLDDELVKVDLKNVDALLETSAKKHYITLITNLKKTGVLI